MEQHPDFQRGVNSVCDLDAARRLATRRMHLLFEQQFFGLEEYIERPHLILAVSQAFFSYDCSSAIKYSLAQGMFPSTILSMGKSQVQKTYIEQIINAEILGAFALTEISHGTNARGMRTEVTYDPGAKEFIVHSPDFEAAKCWVGNLGKTSTHAIVYGQLYVPSDTHRGLHAFLVPIRDVRTLHALPGVTVGDMGEKIGLNGLDNG